MDRRVQGICASRGARSSARVTANACASQTVIVRPGFTTVPLNIKRSPFAGASRLVLNSTVSISALSGASEKAAAPWHIDFASVIGAVLGQAASGLKDAASELGARTGVAGKENEAVKEA